MFFSERIKSIKATDKVLEIGPGGTPHPRSDVLLEKIFDEPGEAKEQRGNVPELSTDKKIVFYQGENLPFADKEFDYTICSHVVEHVENIEKFISEIFRISSKGYIEYPTIYYEYLYNFRVHVNFVKFNNNTLYYLDKNETTLSQFEPIQRLFLQSLEKGYTNIVDDLQHIMFEGFEWFSPFEVKKADSLNVLTFENISLPLLSEVSRDNVKSKRVNLFNKFLQFMVKRDM